MLLGISIKEPPDYCLIRRAVSPGGGLEKPDAFPAQPDGHFCAFLPEGQLFRSGKEIRDNLQRANVLICVFDVFHIFSSPCASIRRR